MAFLFRPTHRNNRTFGSVYHYVDRENKHLWLDLSKTPEDSEAVAEHLRCGDWPRDSVLFDVRIPRTCRDSVASVGDTLHFCDPAYPSTCVASGEVVSILMHPDLGSRNVGRCLIGNWRAI